MTFKAIDAKSVCCRRNTAIGDQKATACVGPESTGRRFWFAAERSTSGVFPGPMMLVFLFVLDAFRGALRGGACLMDRILTCSVLFNSAFVLEAELARLRLVVRRDCEWVVGDFLRWVEPMESSLLWVNACGAPPSSAQVKLCLSIQRSENFDARNRLMAPPAWKAMATPGDTACSHAARAFPSWSDHRVRERSGCHAAVHWCRSKPVPGEILVRNLETLL
jgi:hypothetical protein